MFRSLIVSILFVLSFVDGFSQEADPYQNIYETGMELRKSGEWEKTLNLWMNAWMRTQEASEFDQRITYGFIETVASNKSEFYYRIAHEIYMVTLDKELFKKDPKPFLEEAERLIPLLQTRPGIENTASKIWKKLIKKESSELVDSMRVFWNKRDSDFSTPVNERLLEHWERIAYAKNKFKMNRVSPYNTDDRGTIYVKYGKPYHIKRGTLGNQGIPLKSIYADFPDYEIWLYANLNKNEPVFYVFGNPKYNSYGLLRGIEDFIPSTTFSTSHKSKGVLSINKNNPVDKPASDVPPGTGIQLKYYEELLILGRPFVDRWREIKRVLDLPGRGKYTIARNLRQMFQQEDEENHLQRWAPETKSKYEDIIVPVDIISTHTRFLRNNQPELFVYVNSIPSSISGAFTVEHTLKFNDGLWNTDNQLTDSPGADEDYLSIFRTPLTQTQSIPDPITKDTIYSIAPSRTVESDQSKISYNYTLISKIEYEQKEYLEVSKDEKVEKRFVGSKLIENVLPLNTDETKLEISDMIAGISFPENSNFDNWPYPVLPTGVISEGDELLLYFEIYHLFMNPNSQTNFTIKYEITKVGKKGFIGFISGRSGDKEITAQEMKYSTTERMHKENINFDLSNFEKGEYEISVTIRDINSGQTKVRTGKFNIIE